MFLVGKERFRITKLTYFGEAIPFQSLKRLGRGDWGNAAKSSTETPIQTWWITKAWLELSPLGLPQLSVGFDANLGKH
jgi:hypothetical protein